MSSNQNGPGQGWQYNGNPNNRKPPQNRADRTSWGGIIALYCIGFVFAPLQVLAVVLGIVKVIGLVKGSVNTPAAGSRPGTAQAPGGAQAAPSKGQSAPRTAPPKPSKANPHMKDRTGMSRIIWGGIISPIFALGLTATTATYLSATQTELFSSALTGALSCLLFLCGGLGLLFSGLGARRRRERYLNYLAYIGANREVSLANMAASFDIPVRKLCKDLRQMLAQKVLPTGYLDLATGKLYLTEMGYRAPQPEARPEPEPEKPQDDDILRQIRQINDSIPDVVMSAKIDRIEEITGKILVYQKTHPNRKNQLRSFLSYYLPTTLKILRAYAQLDAQGIEGENISAAKARIEGMMDQVVAGFEKQLDKLFQDDAMDISSDVQVLENMLKKDGLSDDQQGMTMTL